MKRTLQQRIRGRLDRWLKTKTVPPLELSDYPVSRGLIRAFPHLVSHWGCSGVYDLHFQDRELRGALACPPSEAGLLHLAARDLRPERPIEIGSYIGWSSAHIASALAGRLTCVDPFLEIGAGLIETTSEAGKRRFLENMERAGVLQKIDLVCEKSPQALDRIAPSQGWDFAFVDGWHYNDQPLRDVKGILPHLSEGAVVVLHDIWLPDVRDALLYLIAGGFSLYVCETPNFLTFVWKGPLSGRLKSLFADPEWIRLQRADIAPHRERFKIARATLAEFTMRSGTTVLDRWSEPTS